MPFGISIASDAFLALIHKIWIHVKHRVPDRPAMRLSNGPALARTDGRIVLDLREASRALRRDDVQMEGGRPLYFVTPIKIGVQPRQVSGTPLASPKHHFPMQKRPKM